MQFVFYFFTLTILWLNGASSASQPIKDVPEISYLHIKSEVRMRFATTQIVSRMFNYNNHSTEAVFNVILPNTAFISNFSLEMDGVHYTGQVTEKENAQKEFETAKRRGLSAGHVAQKPRETNRFLVTINVAAHSEVKFELRYQQLLQRRLGYYEHPIYVNPGQPVQNVSVEVFILESKRIGFVRVPPIRPTDRSKPATETVNDTQINRPSPLTAHIFYKPSMKDDVLNGAFVIEYEVDRQFDSGEIMAVNGYFVHFFAPEGLDPLPKDILFILDTSHSMAGKKIVQVREAMSEILKDLNPGDRFNLLRFARELKFWQPQMQKWNGANMQNALKWVGQLDAKSITNINDALVEGLKMMSKTRESLNETRTAIVVFLTDGDATKGVRNKAKILANVDEINKYGVPVFGLSFGRDADFDLMQKLSLRNNAVARRIYEASDTSLQLKDFYDEISAALIADLKFTYLGDHVDNTTLTNRRFQNYYNGTEMVVAGKLSDNSTDVSLKIGGSTNKGSLGNIDPVAKINMRNASQGIGLMTDADIQDLPEKLWAYLTIKQLEDKRRAARSQAEKDELSKRMLELSLKYKFVTPVTSMLIVKPEDKSGLKRSEKSGDDESESKTTTVPDTKEPEHVATETDEVNSDRQFFGGGVYGDPHFLVSIRGLSVPVCFHILGKKGDIINLLSDKEKGVFIRAEIMEGATHYQSNSWLKTYMRRIVIQTWWVTLDINPERIVYNGRIFSWRTENAVNNRVINMVINGRGRDVVITLRKGQQFHIRRSVAGKFDNRVKYLDLYLTDGTGLSENTAGVLGSKQTRCSQLRSAPFEVTSKSYAAMAKCNRIDWTFYIVLNLTNLIHVKGHLKNCGKNRKGQTIGKLLIEGGIYSKTKPRLVHAVLNLQHFSLSREPVSCWIVRDGIRDLVKGSYFSRTISPTVAEK